MTLPRFKKPPVIEVAVSVQFTEIKSMSAPHLGLLWAERFRDRYPIATQQAPLSNVQEGFSPTTARTTFEVRREIPVPRCWFQNDQGTQLIQVQTDRFVLNWRKQGTETPYPSYRRIRKQFTQELEEFSDWLQKEELGSLDINQAELTYVNHLFQGEEWSTFREFGNVVSLWSGTTGDDYLPDPEDVRFGTQYVMTVADKPAGRLYVRADPANRVDDNRAVVRLSLIGRGPPEGEGGVEGGMATMDRAHEWIVRAFASITTTDMHTRWERTQ